MMTPHPTPGPGRRPIEVGQWPAHLAQVRQCKEMSMSEWISVEDRLPEVSEWDGTRSEYVLIARPMRHWTEKIITSIGYLVASDSKTGDREYTWHDRVDEGVAPGFPAVTHWMPLPEPPQTAVTEAQP